MADVLSTPGFRDIEAAINLEASKETPDLNVIKELTTAWQSMAAASGVKQRTPTMRDAVSAELAASPKAEQFAAGMGTSLPRMGMGLRGIVGTVPQDQIDELNNVRDATPWTKGGAMVGDMLGFGMIPGRGINTAANVLGKSVLTGRLGATADAALTGAVTNSALTPENRLTSGVMGLTAGLGPAVVGVGQRVTNSGGDKWKTRSSGESLYGQLGDQADSVIQALKTPYGAVPGVQGSAAVVTGNPVLRSLETGSRVKNPQEWQVFDVANTEARFKQLLNMAGTEAEREALRAQREQITSSARQAAMNEITKRVQSGDTLSAAPIIKSIDDELQVLKTGEKRPNPNVQKVVDYAEKQFFNKDGTTPQQLYEAKKFLTGQIKTGPNDELGSAVASARRETVGLVKKIDEALDTLSDGAWSSYLTKYGDASKNLKSQEVLQDVIDAIQKGYPIGKMDIASLSGKSGARPLGMTVERFAQKDLGSKTIDQLTPEHRAAIEALKRDLDATAQAMNMRATGGPGTATELLAASGARKLENSLANIASGGIGGIIGGPAGSAAGAVLSNSALSALAASGAEGQKILARLLQNPQLMAAALEQAKRSQGLLSGSGYGGLIVSGGMAGEGGGLLRDYLSK